MSDAPTARNIEEYHEDFGPVLWWTFPVIEAPWCGRPDDSDWPGYHSWWTPLPPAPAFPADAIPGLTAGEVVFGAGWDQDG